VWCGPGSRDSSDDEWEDNFWAPSNQYIGEVDVQVDTRRMVEETFQQANDSFTLEERVREVALDAFAVADAVHETASEMASTTGTVHRICRLKNRLERARKGALMTTPTLIHRHWRMH
jgi:hypothetical protein